MSFNLFSTICYQFLHIIVFISSKPLGKFSLCIYNVYKDISLFKFKVAGRTNKCPKHKTNSKLKRSK